MSDKYRLAVKGEGTGRNTDGKTGGQISTQTDGQVDREAGRSVVINLDQKINFVPWRIVFRFVILCAGAFLQTAKTNACARTRAYYV